MSYDRKHVLLTWGGTLPGGEEWVNGIRLAGKLSDAELGGLSSISDSFLASLMGSYSPAVKDFHARAATGISSYCNLTHIKAAVIGTNGKYVTGQVGMVLEEFAPIGGTGGGIKYPNQIALAITLTTEVTRGLAKMGRFFLPSPTAAVNTLGVIGTSDAVAIAGSVKTFVEAISDIPGVDIISSPGASVMSKVGAGASNRITGVKVGVVLDTQRRRRNDLAENYQSVLVDQGAF